MWENKNKRERFGNSKTGQRELTFWIDMYLIGVEANSYLRKNELKMN